MKARFAVDTGRDALDAAAAGEATDVGFGDALDVVAENFPENEVSAVLVKFICEEMSYCSPVAFGAAYFTGAEAAVTQALTRDASTSEAADSSFAARSLASGRARWGYVEMPGMRCCCC